MNTTATMTTGPAQGYFARHDLHTHDPAPAQAFYSELFRWRITPETPEYRPIRCGAQTLGVIATTASPASTPASWLSFISVRDVDATASLARKLGGHELVAPRPLADGGRFAVIADPTGATWAAYTRDESRVGSPGVPAPPPLSAAAPGQFCWAQLLTRDVERVRVFYNEVLGWSVQDITGPGGLPSIVFSADARMVAGALQLPEDAVATSHWLPYVAVVDIRASQARAIALGAEVLRPVTELPGMGQFAVLRDPVAANLALWQSASAPRKS